MSWMLTFHEDVYGRRQKDDLTENPDVCESESETDNESSASGGIFKSPKPVQARKAAPGDGQHPPRTHSEKEMTSRPGYRISPQENPRQSVAVDGRRLPSSNRFGIFSNRWRSNSPPSPSAEMPRSRHRQIVVAGDGPPSPAKLQGEVSGIAPPAPAAENGFLLGLEEAARGSVEVTIHNTTDQHDVVQNDSNDEDASGANEMVADQVNDAASEPKKSVRKPGRSPKSEREKDLAGSAEQDLMKTRRKTRGDIEREKVQQEKERQAKRPKTRSLVAPITTKTALSGRKKGTARPVTTKKSPKQTFKRQTSTSIKRGKQKKMDEKLVNWKGKALKLVQGQAYVVVE